MIAWCHGGYYEWTEIVVLKQVVFKDEFTV